MKGTMDLSIYIYIFYYTGYTLLHAIIPFVVA